MLLDPEYLQQVTQSTQFQLVLGTGLTGDFIFHWYQENIYLHIMLCSQSADNQVVHGLQYNYKASAHDSVQFN